MVHTLRIIHIRCPQCCDIVLRPHKNSEINPNMPTIITVFSEQAAEGLRQKWIRNIMGICNSPLRGKSALI